MLEDFSLIEAAASVIVVEDEILLLYNEKWGSFTIPMTKRRHWNDPEFPDRGQTEEWKDTATRASVEALRSPLSPRTSFRYFRGVNGLRQGDRDGKFKFYRIEVFGLNLPNKPEISGASSVAWMTPSQISRGKGVSPTAKKIMSELLSDKLLPWPERFPKNHPSDPIQPRQSISSGAVIKLNLGGRNYWLARYNDSWGSYNWVGGHRENIESFVQCLIREIEEELPIRKGDFVVHKNPIKRIRNYVTFSKRGRTQQLTEYTIDLFEVDITNGQALEAINLEKKTRWLSREEIENGVCLDGKRISQAMKHVLT